MDQHAVELEKHPISFAPLIMPLIHSVYYLLLWLLFILDPLIIVWFSLVNSFQIYFLLVFNNSINTRETEKTEIELIKFYWPEKKKRKMTVTMF